MTRLRRCSDFVFSDGRIDGGWAERVKCLNTCGSMQQGFPGGMQVKCRWMGCLIMDTRHDAAVLV